MRQQPTFEGHDLSELEAVRDEALKARAARLTELQTRWEALQAEAARHGGFFDPGNEEIALQRRDTERSQWNDLYDEIIATLDTVIARRQNKAFKMDDAGFPSDKETLDKFEFVRFLGDSENTKLVKAPDGTLFVAKTGSDSDYLRNEYETDSFYRAVGARVPEGKFFADKKNPVKLTRYVEDGVPLKDWYENATEEERTGMREQLRKDYAIDVLLGNTGVAGDEAEHIIVDKDGNAWRVGNGRAMAYDAQGKEKDDEQWGKNCFVDDLWTMTGNGRRIGQPDITSLPLYDGATDVLEMGNAIMEAKTAWEANKSSPLDLLSPKNRAAVEKRLAEVQQLTTRGNHVMKIEDSGSYPRETALRLLDYSYDMSKDGLREAVKKLKCARKPETVCIDWLQTPSVRKVGGESYETFGDYLAHKMGDEEYDEIQYANYSQGFDSYMKESCRRKLSIWKNNGFDCTDRQKYPSFRAFLQAVEDAGYFTGRTYEENFHDRQTGQVALAKAFVEARKNVDAFNKHATAVLKHDAALQLLFENMTIPGFDPKTRTAILVRTEDGKIEGIVDKRPGDRLEHKTGVCESHTHIQAATYIGDTPTAVRVPFHRIHGVWFMERKGRTKKYQDRMIDDDHQFSAVVQNEIVADTHGLPIILGVGSMKPRKESRRAFDNATFELESWELGHPTETVLEMLK